MLTVGKKLQQARIRKHLSVEEAARATRIRHDKLAELEEDNYANFPSMSYAKGFLVLYARFLDVDISEYADTLVAPNTVSSDDYDYINAGATGPPGPPANRAYNYPRKREHSILPILLFCFLAGAIVLGIFLIVTFQRLGSLDDSTGKTDLANPSASPAISTLPSNPAAASPAPIVSRPAATPTAAPPARTPPPPAIVAISLVPSPALAAATPPPAPAAPRLSPMPRLSPVPISPSTEAATNSDREVRRAVPLAQPSAPPSAAALLAATPPPGPAPILTALAPAASAAPAAPVKQVSILPIRKTRVTIRKDVADSTPVFEDWLYPGAGPLKLTGHKFWIQIEDPTAVEITQDGRAIPMGQSEVHIE